MPLEILHGALVLFSGRARFEGAEIAALAGLRVHFSGIEPVFARRQLSDHGTGLIDTAISSNHGNGPLFQRKTALLEPRAASGRPIRMTTEDPSAEIAAIIARGSPAAAAGQSRDDLESTYQLARNDVA
jgi:hypothetical protein